MAFSHESTDSTAVPARQPASAMAFPPPSDDAPPASATSADAQRKTLESFVRRVAMILQVEKCVVMLYQQETGEMAAQAPALRFTEEEIAALRIRAGAGLTGEVFREGRPVICEDCAGDARCAAEGWARFGMRDSLSVPMVTERRNAGKQVVE